MCGTRRGPASQENINPDAQINQGDQSQPVVEGAISGNQNYVGIKRDGLPHQRVCSLRPDSGAIQLANQARGALDFLTVDGNDLVAGFDARFGARPAGIDAVGNQVPGALHPPDAVIGDGRVTFLLEIEAGKDHRSHCQQEQQHCNKANLAFPIHGFQHWPRSPGGRRRRGGHIPPVFDEQLRCHADSHFWTVKSRK